MKVLLDTCVWGGVAAVLRAAGHDVVSAGEWAFDPGDEQILELAFNDGRVLVTLDKDFGELAIRLGRPHCGILRLVGFSARMQATACIDVLQKHSQDFTSGGLLTAEPGRLRIRS
jgi:predicted nuclease of predicted toxin-antitoxin system